MHESCHDQRWRPDTFCNILTSLVISPLMCRLTSQSSNVAQCVCSSYNQMRRNVLQFTMRLDNVMNACLFRPSTLQTATVTVRQLTVRLSHSSLRSRCLLGGRQEDNQVAAPQHIGRYYYKGGCGGNNLVTTNLHMVHHDASTLDRRPATARNQCCTTRFCLLVQSPQARAGPSTLAPSLLTVATPP